MTEPTWKTVASEKQQQRESKIPAEWQIPKSLHPAPEVTFVQDFPAKSGMFTNRELQLTAATASDVTAKISTGEWTAVEVTTAVCKRAAVAQQLLNCVTEICFDQAIARAKELDAYFQQGGKTVGPLHGLPISLKDQFNVKGFDSTIGYCSYASKPATADSTVVKLLVKAGAIIYVKSNVPVTLMMGESFNNIFGRTLNPRNRELTTGGSSGGEAALVTFCASFLGVGTDIGGSLRIPCSFTGLYGLRPSHGRVSYQHVQNTLLGQEAVRSCAGPMCRAPEDIRLFMSSLAAQQPWLWDPQSLPLPWRAEEEVLPKKLCFGFALGDGHVGPSKRLKQAGHAVINFNLTEGKEVNEIMNKMFTADGGAEFQRDTDATGEPLPPTVEYWLGHSSQIKASTVSETWKNQHKKALLAQKFLEKWQATKGRTGTSRPIDGLIMPSTPFPASRHGSGWPWHFGDLSALLDLTTGVFPVTRVNLEKDAVPPSWTPMSVKDKEAMDYYEKPENHENALVGLQLIGRRLEEEKVTAMLTLIRNVLEVDY